MTVDRASFDDLVTLVTQAPPWEKDRVSGVRVLLQAVGEGKADAPEQILARWTWRLARATRKAQDRRASAEFPGGEAAARGTRQLTWSPSRGERGRALVAATRELPLPVAAALLASAEGYTPRATKLLDAAREELGSIDEVARGLGENLPPPKVQTRRSRRRRRRKKRGGQPASEAPRPVGRRARRTPRQLSPSDFAPAPGSTLSAADGRPPRYRLPGRRSYGDLALRAPDPADRARGRRGRRPQEALRHRRRSRVSFFTFTLFAAWLLGRLGLPKDLLRNIALALLFLLAAALIIPPLGPLLEGRSSIQPPRRSRREQRLPARSQPRAGLRPLRGTGVGGDHGHGGKPRLRVADARADSRLLAGRRRRHARVRDPRTACVREDADVSCTRAGGADGLGVIMAAAALGIALPRPEGSDRLERLHGLVPVEGGEDRLRYAPARLSAGSVEVHTVSAAETRAAPQWVPTRLRAGARVHGDLPLAQHTGRAAADHARACAARWC